jgi:hypothetical protein
MSWVKHDDGFSQNRKVIGLSDKAYRLHFCGLEHCARNLTDGTIMDYEFPSVYAVAHIKAPQKYVKELVSARLWRLIAGGYEINQYLDYNPSAAMVDEQRKRNAERQKAHRNRVSNGVTNDVTNGVSNTAPTRPVPKDQEHSRPEPVDKFLKFAEDVGLWQSQRLDALNLGPALLEEAMRATERCGPTNRAAYFDVCVKGFLSAQRQWKSSMPLEQRLEIYVRNAGYIYEDDDLESELFEKGADDVMVKRLVRVAEEVRNAA